jgi:hypothetical protein
MDMAFPKRGRLVSGVPPHLNGRQAPEPPARKQGGAPAGRRCAAAPSMPTFMSAASKVCLTIA